MLGAQSPEYGVELGFKESAESMLVENDIARFWRELRQDVCVPSVAYQDAAFAATRCLHDRSDTHSLVSDVVGAVLGTCVRKVCVEGHLQVDHRNAVEPSRRKYLSSGLDSTLDHRDVDAGPVEHAAFRAEVVLHIDNENGTGRDIDRHRVRLGLDR